MNDMRKLINLMEGVTAVPGINQPVNEISAETLDSYRMKRIAQKNDPAHSDPNWQRTAQNISKAFYKAKGKKDAAYKKKMNYDPSAEYSDDYGVWKKEQPYESSDNVELNELSRNTLKSYSKERGREVQADVTDARRAADLSHKKGDKWDDESNWLSNRAEKGAAGVARATTKIAAKKDIDEGHWWKDPDDDPEEIPQDLIDKYCNEVEYYMSKGMSLEKALLKMKREIDTDEDTPRGFDSRPIYKYVRGEMERRLNAEDSIDEKSSSEKQARFMAACAHGADYDSCPPDKVSKEFNQADKGTKQLSNAMKEAQVDTCRQSNPNPADEACAMEEDSEYDFNFIRSSISHLYNYSTNEEELKKMVAGETGYGDNPEFDNLFNAALDDFLERTETEYSDGPGEVPMDEARGSDIDPNEIKSLVSLDPDSAKARALEIVTASRTSDSKKQYLTTQIGRARNTMEVIKLLYNMVLAGEGNAVQGSNTRYNDKFRSMEEAYDLQNGYDDVEVATGSDYFPNGADGPVVKKVGPSGARHGDNPEQKKMEVTETHKELVYAYRNFLKESADSKKSTT